MPRYDEKWLLSRDEWDLWRKLQDAVKGRTSQEDAAAGSVRGFIETLKENRVAGLCYAPARERAGDGGQWAVLAELLREEYLRQCALRKVREQEVIRLLERLCAKGLRPVIMKGLYLQYFVYGREQCRPSSDIDILFPEREGYVKAVLVCQDMGYRKYLYYSGTWERNFTKSVTFNPDMRSAYYEVDVHGSVAYCARDRRYAFDREFAPPGIYEERELLGFPVLVMKPWACFVHLVHHHFEIHCNEKKFLWLHDLEVLAREFRRDLPEFRELAARTGTGELVDYAFELIDRLERGGPEQPLLPAGRAARRHPTREKLRNISGLWNKALWLGCWLLPSGEYLRKHYGPGRPVVLLRFIYLFEKTGWFGRP